MSKVKVLYVEDEPFLAKIVKESLESREYQVSHVDDGLGVLPALEQFKPHICILDVMLPHIDGFSLGTEIRQKYPDLPILFLTAKNQTQDLLKGFRSGGNDYIRKPFSMEELIVRMNNLLELMQISGKEKAPEEKHIIPLGQYLYHSKKYELQFGESIQKLSYREAQLLNILVENQNLAVHRKDILKKVWGDDSFFNSRNLDVYITKLRNYLKKDPSIKIVTLKGVGYHFVVE